MLRERLPCRAAGILPAACVVHPACSADGFYGPERGRLARSHSRVSRPFRRQTRSRCSAATGPSPGSARGCPHPQHGADDGTVLRTRPVNLFGCGRGRPRSVLVTALLLLAACCWVTQAQYFQYKFANLGLNLEVPDGGIGTFVQHTVSNGLLGDIQKITLSVDISGTWSGDLYAYLNVGGAHAVLLNRVGRTTRIQSATAITDSRFGSMTRRLTATSISTG